MIASSRPDAPSGGPLTPAHQPEVGPSKTRLLETVKRRGAVSTQALAEALEISIPAARRHLQDLLEAGLIEARTEKPGGRGRPQHVYSLSERGEGTFPKSYASLCGDVLRHVQTLFGEGAVLQVMDARRLELHRQLTPLVGQGDLGGRVQTLARLLKEAGYASEAVFEGGHWYLLERNCPALKVAREFSQLCDAELSLYRGLLGVPVERESRLACGAPECRYRIG